MSLMARIRLRSTLIKSASRGNDKFVSLLGRKTAALQDNTAVGGEKYRRDFFVVVFLPNQLDEKIYRHCDALFSRRRVRRRGRLLFVIEPIDDAPRLDTAGVGIDVDLRRVGLKADHPLLRRKHRDVLEEGGLDLLEDAFDIAALCGSKSCACPQK